MLSSWQAHLASRAPLGNIGPAAQTQDDRNGRAADALGRMRAICARDGNQTSSGGAIAFPPTFYRATVAWSEHGRSPAATMREIARGMTLLQGGQRVAKGSARWRKMAPHGAPVCGSSRSPRYCQVAWWEDTNARSSI